MTEILTMRLVAAAVVAANEPVEIETDGHDLDREIGTVEMAFAYALRDLARGLGLE